MECENTLHNLILKVVNKLDNIEKLLKEQALETDISRDYLKKEEVLHLLDAADKTLYHYRRDGDIGFCQFGKLFLYPRQDIIAFLKKHYNPPFNPNDLGN